MVNLLRAGRDARTNGRKALSGNIYIIVLCCVLQLLQQADLLRQTVNHHVNVKLRELDQMQERMDERLSLDMSRWQLELMSTLNMQQDISDALEVQSASELVGVAMQIREQSKAEEHFPPMSSSVVWPGLVCSSETKVDETISQFLGCSRELSLPADFHDASRVPNEEIRMVLNIGNGAGHYYREILWVSPFVTDGLRSDQLTALITYRGDPPHRFSSSAWVNAGSGRLYDVYGPERFEGKFVIVPYGPLGGIIHGLVCPQFRWLQLSKSEPQLSLCREESGCVGVRAVDIVALPLVEGGVVDYQAVAGPLLFRIDAVDPFNFDVSGDGQFFAVIDSGGDGSGPPQGEPRTPANGTDLTDDSGSGQREGSGGTESDLPPLMGSAASDYLIRQPREGGLVKLYRRGREDPVAVYQPEKSPFAPSDVRFWREGPGGTEKLLIADWHHDDVHVARLSDDGFCFERYLAAGHGDLVKPSALNTDRQGGVWIGCSNGSLLVCQKTNTPAWTGSWSGWRT